MGRGGGVFRLAESERRSWSSGGRNPNDRREKSYQQRLCGEAHPSGVRFTEQGFPDFSPYSKAEVEIEGLTGNYAEDAAVANKAVGLG